MFFVVQITEFICFLFALIFLRNTNNIVWVVIKWFMLFTFVIEMIASIIVYKFHSHNLWIYTLYTPVEFLVVAWALYHFLPKHKLNLPLLAGGSIAFCILYILEVSSKGIFVNCFNSNLFSDIFLFFACNWFFYLLLKQDEWIEIHKHAAFWFVTGLFLYNFCATVTDLFDNALLVLFITPAMPLRYPLYIVFNLALYGCWSFSFVCKYQETI